jgi:hypothetical protein
MAARFAPFTPTTSGMLWCGSCGETIHVRVSVAPGAVLEALSWHYGAKRVRFEGSGHCTFALSAARGFIEPKSHEEIAI